MGGLLFKGQNRRYSRNEYEALAKELEPLFAKHLEQFNPCPYLDDKESFGDMDVVYVGDLDPLLQELSVPVKWNGPATSFLYKEFQVDMIKCTPEEYEFSKFYYGLSDAGNFYGKLAHITGCKFGHDGLTLPVRLSDDHLLGEVVLTRDPKVACDFLDVDYRTSFKDFESLFKTVVASKYFNPDSYKLENNNAVARVRDKKRPAYGKFLEMCATLPADRDYFPRAKDKTIWLSTIFQFFPKAKEEYDKLVYQKHLADEFAKKLNGDLVRKWTALEGERLGNFMKYLKTYLTKENTKDLTAEEVEERAFGFWQAYKLGY